MCHVSVGHVARAIEAAGIPTVVAMSRVFLERVQPMRLPRVVVTRHLMARPLGAPHDAERQTSVIRAALGLLESATANGALLELPEAYRLAP